MAINDCFQYVLVFAILRTAFARKNYLSMQKECSIDLNGFFVAIFFAMDLSKEIEIVGYW